MRWSNQKGDYAFATDAAEDTEEYLLCWLHNAGEWGVGLEDVVRYHGAAGTALFRSGQAKVTSVLNSPALVITEQGEAELEIARLAGETNAS